jgi:hypothetical protein
MEQEVCQLLLAALGQKIDAKWQKIATHVWQVIKKSQRMKP